jgi:hypothetical protein
VKKKKVIHTEAEEAARDTVDNPDEPYEKPEVDDHGYAMCVEHGLLFDDDDVTPEDDLYIEDEDGLSGIEPYPSDEVSEDEADD